MQAASLRDQLRCRADALHGALVHAGGEPGRAAQLDDELVELGCLLVLGEQEGLLRQRGDGDRPPGRRTGDYAGTSTPNGSRRNSSEAISGGASAARPIPTSRRPSMSWWYCSGTPTSI